VVKRRTPPTGGGAKKNPCQSAKSVVCFNRFLDCARNDDEKSVSASRRGIDIPSGLLDLVNEIRITQPPRLD